MFFYLYSLFNYRQKVNNVFDDFIDLEIGLKENNEFFPTIVFD
tara:strand:- start:30 stop:158 length:129 start_codon:yes stop_codon:yes gene_type:complete